MMRFYSKPAIVSYDDHAFSNVHLQSTGGLGVTPECSTNSSYCGGTLGYTCSGQTNADWHINLELGQADCTTLPKFENSGCTVQVTKQDQSGSLNCTTGACSGNGCTDAAAYQISCINGSFGNTIGCTGPTEITVTISCPDNPDASCDLIA